MRRGGCVTSVHALDKPTMNLSFILFMYVVASHSP
jgi:hypothetical protein